jgi:hypothetical protein
VEFTFEYSQRWSYPGTAGSCPNAAAPACPALNAAVTLTTWSGGNFTFGDNTAQTTISGTVTSLNQAEDWATATFKFQHAYSTANASYTAYFYAGNRISTLKLGHDQPEYISVLVKNYPNGTPVASAPAILAVPLQNTATFNIGSAVTDIDPNVTVKYRLSTFAEIFGPSSVSGLTSVPCPSGGAYVQNGVASGNPPGFSISPSGVVTWDETKIASTLSATNVNCGFGTPVAGDLWVAQVMAQAVDNTTGIVDSQVPVDLMLKFVNPVGELPTLTLTPAGPQTVSVGTPVTFTATGNSANAGAKITLNASGVPAGANATSLNAALTPPAVSNFSWIPSASQYGTYVVTFTATDNNLQQVTASESIIVASLPSATCGPAQTVSYGTPATVSTTIFDQNKEMLNLAWSVDGTAVHTESGILAYPAPQTVAYSQDFGAAGDHQVSVVATDPHGVTATCSTSVKVTPADQTINFAPLPNVAYGAPDFNLAASSTSGLLATFAANGNCTLLNGYTLHITGAGACQVSASQPGDENHNPAPTVSQSFTIAKAAAVVTPNSASKTYGQADPALTGVLTGFLPADNVTATYSRSAGESVLSGPYAISANLGPASALANYNITYNTAQLTITPARLTVTANNATRSYGAADPAFTGTISGILNNDAISATYSSTATAQSAVGSYSIVPALSGAALSNYAVTANNGTLTVTAVPLVVTPADASRAYGATNPAFSGSITGIQNNDPISATYSTSATTAFDPGNYLITAQLNDAQNKLGNYSVTLNTGTLTIVKANQAISWAAPAAISYGTPLSAAQLNAAVSVTGPAAAGAVTYSPAAGTVLDAGAQTLTVSAAGTTDYNPATATVLLTVNKTQPVFSGLNNANIVYHAGSVTLNGALTTPTAIPAGQQVAITLNNVTQNAVVASNGSFNTTFNTAALPVSANGYTVSYSFAGSNDFAAASATSKLTVAYAVCDLYNTVQAKQSGSTYPIIVAVCDANNQNVSTPGMVLSAVGWGVSILTFSPVPDAGNSNGNGTFRNTGGSFMWNLQTTGMASGNYNVFFTISGDPTLHFAPFAVR